MTPTTNDVEPTTSATDELRRMLDERVVEHVDEKDGKFLLVTWSYNETSATFVEDTVSGETSIAISAIVSPEQAIAATLGSCNCSNNCMNSERTGTLTAERVMAIAGKHQPDYCSDTHVCFDWQAIADELNVTLGRWTCHPIISDNLAESEGTGDAWADCSECGHLLFVLTDPTSEPPNYCPNCGRKVVGE